MARSFLNKVGGSLGGMGGPPGMGGGIRLPGMGGPPGGMMMGMVGVFSYSLLVSHVAQAWWRSSFWLIDHESDRGIEITNGTCQWCGVD